MSDNDRSNTRDLRQRSGGEILVDQLRVHGVDRAFCVPGESYLAALDAFHDADDMRLVICRQEGGAAMMAEAHGKLTGQPGIVFVTRGPGATNASAGLHIGQQDSTPMILFIGQVGRSMLDREAFQEIDFRQMYGPMAKWVAQIEDPARIPEYVSRAFQVATSGRPGPVVLALPEDMLREQATVADGQAYVRAEAAPSDAVMDRLADMLVAAKRPLAIVGGGGWDAKAVSDFQSFAERWSLPVGASFRAHSHYDNRLDTYVGDIGIGINPRLAQRVKDADLILAVGARLGESTTSGYTLLQPPVPTQKLVHIYPDPEELGRVYHADLPITAGMGEFAAAAAALQPLKPMSSEVPGWLAEGRTDYLAHIQPTRIVGDMQMGEIVAWLSRELPDDTIIANGAGNYAGWLSKNYQFKQYRTQLASTSGSMGYGVPAAVAAKLLFPDRLVVNFAGDGCFMMNGQELATAIQYGANIITIVVNNSVFGTIRMHQERDYPGRKSGTGLKNPDFAALARAYGAHGETIRRTEDFYPAFERARAAKVPSLIEIILTEEASTARASLSDIRRAGEAQRDHVGRFDA